MKNLKAAEEARAKANPLKIAYVRIRGTTTEYHWCATVDEARALMAADVASSASGLLSLVPLRIQDEAGNEIAADSPRA